MSHMPVTTQSATQSVTNVDAAALVIGTPVYAYSASGVKKAIATALSTSRVLGVINISSLAVNDTGAIATAGDIMAATTAQWDAVCGTSGGLTFNTVYYLSTTAGLLTATAPSTTGQCVVPVILALSTTTALVLAERPVLL